MARRRSSMATAAAIAVLAYAACDVVHEVLGHGLAAWLTPGVKAVALSTVALSTQGASRTVAAAGTIANLATGALALWGFRRGGEMGAARYFLWLFGTVSLFNGTGYLAYSGVLDFGDWAAVISRTPPAGSKSVASTSTSCELCCSMKAVCGTVTGVSPASCGIVTTTRTSPVAVVEPSVTVYST